MTIQEALRRFLTEMEKVDDQHPGVRDMEVQDYIWETIAFTIVHGQVADKLPIVYGMDTAEGDEAVATAVHRFISNAKTDSRLRSLPPEDCLELLQDATVETEDGSTYTDFIG